LLQVIAGAPQYGTVQVTPVGTLNYMPPPDFHGTDTLTYTIHDGAGGTLLFSDTNTALVTITVSMANDAPVVVTDTATITAGQSITLSVLANDFDVDSAYLRLTGVSAPAGDQAVARDNNVIYTPAAGPARAAQFSYTAADEHGGLSSGDIVVAVLSSEETAETVFYVYLPLVFKE